MGKRITTINLPLNAATQSYTLPTSNELDGKRVHQIYIRNVAAKAYDGRDLPSATVINSGYITIAQGTQSVTKVIPLSHFIQDEGCDCRCMPEISAINLSQTEITFKIAPANNTTLELVVCYEEAVC